MTQAATSNLVPRLWLGAWMFTGLAAAWFVYDSVIYVASRVPQPGATFLNRQLWYLAHMAIATPILVIAPLQFLASLRRSKPEVHRWLGRAFLTASFVAGLLAVWLGATIQYQGSRIPLTIFGIVWVLFSVAAWICARQRDYANHRKFAIRSFAIGLAFVWVRLLGAFEDQLFPFIENQDVVDTTQEFLSFVLPLLLVETWLSWLPAVQSASRR